MTTEHHESRLSGPSWRPGAIAYLLAVSSVLVINNADTIEAMQGSGAIWALRLDDCTAWQRADLIDHHAKVLHVLRKHGHKVRAGMVTDETGHENLALRQVGRR